MKKKFLAIVLLFVCVLTCAAVFVSCDDKPSATARHLYATDGVNNDYHGLTSYNVSIEYGANLDLTKYKLFLEYSDGSTKEVVRNDEKLAVKYYSQTNGEKQELQALPNDLICGDYTIEYVYDSNAELKAAVNISVLQSGSGAFSVLPVGGTTWQSQGAVHKVIVKNPKGAEVKMEWVYETVGDGATSGTPKPIEKNDDTDGHYNLLLFKKSVYDSFTAEQKKDYYFLSTQTNAYTYNPEFDEVVGVSEGEYILIALIEATYNYSNVVSSTVQITVAS